MAGGYNGNVIRTSILFASKKLEAEPARTVDLYVVGKKGINYMTFQKRPITDRVAIS